MGIQPILFTRCVDCNSKIGLKDVRWIPTNGEILGTFNEETESKEIEMKGVCSFCATSAKLIITP